jgi:hypothetical protein
VRSTCDSERPITVTHGQSWSLDACRHEGAQSASALVRALETSPKLVVRGRVELPTFRFSGCQLCGLLAACHSTVKPATGRASVPSTPRPEGPHAMSDSGSRMGAADRAQVRPSAVIAPLPRRLTCLNATDQARFPAVCSVRIEGVRGSNPLSSTQVRGRF